MFMDLLKVYGHSGSASFYRLILFNTCISKLSDHFHRFTKFKVIFEIYVIKAREFNRFLMEGGNKLKRKKNYFFKNLSPTVIKQSFSNFQSLLITNFKPI